MRTLSIKLIIRVYKMNLGTIERGSSLTAVSTGGVDDEELEENVGGI